MAGVTTYYQAGVHGSRPANAAGCVLYACSTHGLIYRDDGTTWTTFATLGGSGLSDPMTTRGDVIVRNSSNATARLAVGAAGKILSSDGTDVSWGNGPMTTAGDIIIGGASGLPTRLAAGATSGHVLTSNGSGSAPSWQASSGGGGATATHPTLVQQKLSTTAATSMTLDTAPVSGHSLILFANTLSGPLTAISSTNTTWTKMKQQVTGGATYQVWVGVVSGTGGTAITFTGPGGFNLVAVLEVTDTLTGTAGVTSGGTTVNAISLTGTTTPRLVVLAAGQDNTGVASYVYPPVPSVGFNGGFASVMLFYAYAANAYAQVLPIGNGQYIMCEIT